jgi:hypothetical protein
VTHFYIFGSHAWAKILYEKRKTLDPHRKKWIFVRYPDGVKGYRLIGLSSNCLIIELNVQFEEGILHVPQYPHAKTYVLPPVRDDDHAHVDSSLDEIFYS